MKQNFTKLNRKVFEKKLFTRFKKMYQNHKLPMSQTCMCWGIECNHGWYDLLWNLSLEIEKVLKKDKKLEKNFRVDQVKEKFAGLRFYEHGGNEEIDDIIYKYEELSYLTCEECGKVSKKNNTKKLNNWLFNRCSECFKKVKKEME